MLRSGREACAWKESTWAWMIITAFLLFPTGLSAQTWSWSTQMVDLSGKSTSVVADQEGNLHLSYRVDEGGILKYGFRPAKASQWFTMVLDRGIGDTFTRITVDSKGLPYICYAPSILKYAHWDGQRWAVQQIAPSSGEVGYTCSVVVAEDGTPYVTWMQSQRILRYALLRDGAWLARTLDSTGFSGKWNSIVLDARGNPHICYSRFIPMGELVYGSWDGKDWHFRTIDTSTTSAAGGNRGMGNSLVLGSEGHPSISYYDDAYLKYASSDGNRWSIEVVDRVTPAGGYMAHRSTLLLDQQGHPHISYEGRGGLKHAYWDGKRWHSEVVVPPTGDSFYYNSMTIDMDDTLYISYRDPADNSVKLAIGVKSPARPTAAAQKENDKN